MNVMNDDQVNMAEMVNKVNKLNNLLLRRNAIAEININSH